MDALNGMNIIESPFIQPVPKLQLSAGFNSCSDSMKSDMNKWLLDMFGEYLPCYVLFGKTIVAAPKHVAMLRNKLKGGA